MKTKNGISIIFSILISFSAYSQTSVEYQNKIDSLERIKSTITIELNELEKQIIILKEQKSEVWANEQVGQIFVFIRDGDIYNKERNYQSVGKVKKGKRVIFIKEAGEYGMEVLLDGEKYFVKSRWLKSLDTIRSEQKAKAMGQKTADSLAIINATPMQFIYNAPIYKSSSDTKPLFEVPNGTKILFVKSIKAKGASNCLIIYNGEEYYASIYDLTTEEQIQQKLEQERLAKEKREKSKMYKEERKKALTALYGTTAANKIIERKIWLGMSDEMAIESWGKPDDINRTVSAYGVKEQWIYGDISNRTYLYFENGELTTWQD